MFRAVQSYISLILPPNASLFQRTVRFYVSLILLATLVALLLYIITFLYYTPSLDLAHILLVISIDAYVGFFALFALIVFFIRLLRTEMEQLPLTQHLFRKAKRRITQTRMPQLSARLMLIVIPVVILIISVGFPFVVLLGGIDNSDIIYEGIAELFNGYAEWIFTIATVSGVSLMGGFVILGVLGVLLGARVTKTVKRNILGMVVGLILLVHLIGLGGFTLFVVADEITGGAATNIWTSVLFYGLIAVFTLIFISFPFVSVLFARQWRVIAPGAVPIAYDFGTAVTLMRTFRFYVFLMLFANAVASPIILISGDFTSSSAGTAIFIIFALQAFAGFFTLFVLSAFLVRLLVKEIGQMEFANRISGTKQKRTLRLTGSLILIVAPIALIAISVGFLVLTLLNAPEDGSELSRVSELLLNFAGAFTLGAGFIMFFQGFAAIVIIIGYLVERIREPRRGKSPANGVFTSSGGFIAAIALTLPTGLGGFFGLVISAFLSQSALWYNVSFYGLLSVCVVIGILALAVLSARAWRERTPPPSAPSDLMAR